MTTTEKKFHKMEQMINDLTRLNSAQAARIHTLEEQVNNQNEALDKSIEEQINELPISQAINFIGKMQCSLSQSIRKEIYEKENQLGVLNLELETLEVNADSVAKRRVYSTK